MFVYREEIMPVLEKYKKFLEDKGFDVYAVTLKGSQNYNLADEESDVDATAIILPTLEQLIKGEKFSKKYKFDEGELLINDIYTFSKLLEKGNHSWIEMVNSRYMIGDLSIFKDCVSNPKALKGMMLEKRKALLKRYPSRAEYIDKFGFDPKQLHHIFRLYDIVESMVDRLTMETVITKRQYVVYEDKYDIDFMMNMKRNGKFFGKLMSPEEAENEANICIKFAEHLLKFCSFEKNIIDYRTIEKIIKENIIKNINK